MKIQKDHPLKSIKHRSLIKCTHPKETANIKNNNLYSDVIFYFFLQIVVVVQALQRGIKTM